MKSRHLLPPSSGAQATERILLRSCFKPPGRRTVFDARRKLERELGISSLLEYLKELLGETVNFAMVLKLVCLISTKLALTSDNLFRLVLTACVLTRKMLDDVELDNAVVAKSCEIPLVEFNEMERSFLRLCDYRLYMAQHEFECYLRILVKETLR